MPPKLSGRVLDILLPALVALDEDYLRMHPKTPPIYASGVRYEPEPPGQEQWLTIPWILMRKAQGRGADCEDLACWRTAELRVRAGENAKAVWSCRKTAKGTVYHIRVKRSNGKIEDPSAALGMGPNWAQNFGENHFITDGERT